MSLLPDLETPRITRVRGPLQGRAADELDAVLAIVPEGITAKSLSRLPGGKRWQELHARRKARAGTVRSTALTNNRQTLAVLGYLKADASAFECLALAGRMLREAAGRLPKAIALFAQDDAMAHEALLAAALAQAFALPSYQSKPSEAPRIERIVLAGGEEVDLARATASARGSNLARWLTALPPNVLDAAGYRQAIAELAKRYGLKMRWLDERELRKRGANAFLAVAAGNADRTAGIAHLEYRPGKGARAAPEVALVGKGIIFDTGGTNLKAHRSMLDMHMDMAGSAVALATLLALAELKAPIAADAWLAITENRTGPTAYKPQDVIKAANGVTIQVIHTDAEGRMALADTLVLASQTKPRLVLDFATLTGTCVFALSERMSGVFTNRPNLAEKLMAAGRASGERVWNFPFDEDYDSDLESKVADIVQCALESKADHILAARFLSRFVPYGMAWAHFDLSAAMRTGGLGHVSTDITGFGVRYTLELLLGQNVLRDLGRAK
jgi:leucyl aminopeptidase